MPRERTISTAAVVDECRFGADRSAFGAVLSRVGAALVCTCSSVWRTAGRRPWDSLGAAAAAIATVAIFVNAVLLQASPHPAPILPAQPRPVAEATGSVIMLPRPRPGGRETNSTDVPAGLRTRAQIVSDIQRELARRGFFDGPIDGLYGARTDAAIRDFEQAAGLKGGARPDEALLRMLSRSNVAAPSTPAAAPVRPTAATRSPAPLKAEAPSRRVLAVQRALADFGYGQVRPSGVLGADTKAAIERFERERKLPVTGQISDRLIRELAAVTGRPLE